MAFFENPRKKSLQLMLTPNLDVTSDDEVQKETPKEVMSLANLYDNDKEKENFPDNKCFNKILSKTNVIYSFLCLLCT
jgi:hypothetical protein